MGRRRTAGGATEGPEAGRGPAVLGDGPAHLIDGTTTVTDHEGYREIDLSPGQCLLVREIVG
jgi:hypothetical protein